MSIARYAINSAVIILAAGAIWATVRSKNMAPLTAAVKIEQNRFIPTSVTIRIGGSVSFANYDSTRHLLASDPHPTHTDYPLLNIGALMPIALDGIPKLITFTQKGIFGFHDELNPRIKGRVVVE